MNAVVQAVATTLARRIPEGETVCVALSGGMDSVVLLDALIAAAAIANIRPPVSAVHVHHGLSPHADAWTAFCSQFCAVLSVPLHVERVNVAVQGRGLEDAAREARYAVFRARPERWILQAHHADDAVETLLLRLNRGTGLKGLAGIPAERALGPDQWLLRPLLQLPRSALHDHATARGLAWIEDESNTDARIDRNFLRTAVLPHIEGRFPAYRRNWVRAAEHAATAQTLLDELAVIDTGDVGQPLPLAKLRVLSSNRLRNALRHFLTAQGAEAPVTLHMADIERRLRDCDAGSRLAIRVGDHALMHARGLLHLVPARMMAPPPPFSLPLWPGVDLPLPVLSGQIRWQAGVGTGIAAKRLESSACTVRGRLDGEHLKPVAGRPTRTLKNLFQELGVPEWERAWLPRIACGDDIVWIPGVGIAADWQAQPGEQGWLPRWEAAQPVPATGAAAAILSGNANFHAKMRG